MPAQLSPASHLRPSRVLYPSPSPPKARASVRGCRTGCLRVYPMKGERACAGNDGSVPIPILAALSRVRINRGVRLHKHEEAHKRGRRQEPPTRQTARSLSVCTLATGRGRNPPSLGGHAHLPVCVCDDRESPAFDMHKCGYPLGLRACKSACVCVWVCVGGRVGDCFASSTHTPRISSRNSQRRRGASPSGQRSENGKCPQMKDIHARDSLLTLRAVVAETPGAK